MSRLKIAWKLFLTYVVIIIICTGTAGIFAGMSLKNYYLESIASDLESNTRLVRDSMGKKLLAGDFTGIDRQSKFLGDEISARITIVNKRGVVLGDSGEDPAEMENHAARPEIKSALAGETGRSTRYSNTLKMDMMYLALPVLRDGEVIGVTRVALPLTEVRTKVVYIYKVVCIGALIALCVAIVIGMVTARVITRPVREMTELAGAMAGGDFGRKIRITSKDEIGQLAGAFNRMAEELKDRIENITGDRNRMQAVLGSVVEGVLAIDSSEKLILVNPALERMFGIEGAGAAGKYFWEVIRNNELNELLRAVREKKEHRSREFAIYTPGERILQAHAVPIRSGEAFLGEVAVLHDITEIKRIEKMRADFVANVSHELRTPLTAMKGFVETLRDGAIDEPENSRQFLKIIEDHMRRLNNLVDDLLELSKLETKEIEMDFQPVDLRGLAEEVISEYGHAIERKGHAVGLDFPPVSPQVMADRGMIKQALGNLLDNAVKFTPDRGSICIRCSVEAGSVRVEVSDNGIGIPQSHIPRLFERFYRVDKGRSREMGGTGLGLSIVKHIVQAHGGETGVESEPGKGSKFFFTLKT